MWDVLATSNKYSNHFKTEKKKKMGTRHVQWITQDILMGVP